VNAKRFGIVLTLVLVLAAPTLIMAQLLGEGPRLDPNRPVQADIENGLYPVDTLVLFGRNIFSTPFNRYDGYGDGPVNPANTRDPGGRPVLAGLSPWPEVVLLRVNGLDSSACLDCHGQGSMRTIPPIPAIGGVGNISNQVIGGPRFIDVADEVDGSGNPGGDGIANIDGRTINPPFNFGAGGVELLAKEMTADLRKIAEDMWDACQIDTRPLVSKGVYFGTLTLTSIYQTSQTSQVVSQQAQSFPDPIPVCALQFVFKGVEGIAKPKELLVAPFGRKGDAFSIRNFDQNAMRFHFGMEPTELFPGEPDHDGDNVYNEILPGDLSMLSIFQADLPRPVINPLGQNGRDGYRTFIRTGCAYCHRPVLQTNSRYLPVSFPEVEKLFPNGGPLGGFGDPFGNAFLNFDLTRAGFAQNASGGLYVPLFADLKRHAMGQLLAENNQPDTLGNQMFTTARLWGVCDTEPYLHDSRAFTLNEAIIRHGGEAEGARLLYENLSEYEKNLILEFLCKLRTPVDRSDGTTYAPAPSQGGETTAEELQQIYDDEIAIYGPDPGGVANYSG
jgi:hypothetical protein